MTETELETIVKEAVKAKTGLEVGSVTFNVGIRSVGYGMNEQDVHYFESATVSFKPGQDIKAGEFK